MDQHRPDSVLQSWPTHVATAVATGVVTTYLPVQRWSRGARWGLHGGMATLAAGGMAMALRRPELVRGRKTSDGPEGPAERGEAPGASGPREPMAVLPTAVVAVAFGALVLGASRGGESLDDWAERALTRRGVRRPRLWMGVAAAGASLAMSVSDERRLDRGPTEDPEAR